jgi:hypothetical protein
MDGLILESLRGERAMSRILALMFFVFAVLGWSASVPADGWHIVPLETQGSTGEYTSIALDSNDYPHISYYAFFASERRYARWNGRQWQTEAVNTAGDVGLWLSMKLDSHDQPHISYEYNYYGDLYYVWYESTAGFEDADLTAQGSGFVLPRSCRHGLSLYDVQGRKVMTLSRGTLQPGEHAARVEGVPPGIYLYQLRAGSFSGSGRLVVR